MPSTTTRKKSNRKVGPKEAQARQQRATKAAEKDATVDANPAKAAAAIDAKVNGSKNGKTTTRPAGQISAREAAIKVMKKQGEPMRLKDIADKAIKLASHLGGKDPKHAIRSQVVMGSINGNTFKRVGKGTYALLDSAPVKKV